MKKYNVIYDWPISEITRLSDSDIAGQFADTLHEPEQTQFVTLSEKIRSFLGDLQVARDTKTHFHKWEDIRSQVGNLCSQFSSFPSLSISKIKLSLLLAEKISQIAPELDEDDIDPNLFKLHEVTNPLQLEWFCRENIQSLEDSIVIFEGGMTEMTIEQIESSNISTKLLFQFIATLHETADIPPTQTILVKYTTPEIEASAINAFARLSVLSTGKPVHLAHTYDNTPSILDIDEIKPSLPYQQWYEVLNVISEYNSRKEILIKYLTIYHVIENFMFKHPIVELERQRNGEMFSIRDFRRLYDGIDMNELNALKRVFKSVFAMQATPNITFAQHLVTRWKALVPTVSQADIDSALKEFSMNLSFNNFKDEQAASPHSFFSNLVYSIRNAIVHNKETEFHLTYASLNSTPAIIILLESFLLPSLEEICFSLIGKTNTDFWYQNKEIVLYQ